MTRKEYNGWTNYETWLFKLWMDNDEGSQSYWREIAEDCFKTDGECAKGSLAHILLKLFSCLCILFLHVSK